MEENAAQVYSLIQIGFVLLVTVLALVAFVLQARRRPYGSVALVVRAVVALAVFVTWLVVSGVAINWLWAGVFGVIGAGLGFASGRLSKITMGERGRPYIKKSPWPALVSAISYVIAAVALVYGTAGLFSVALLVVLLGAMMTVGATVAEIMQGEPDTSSQDAASATAAAPEQA